MGRGLLYNCNTVTTNSLKNQHPQQLPMVAYTLLCFFYSTIKNLLSSHFHGGNKCQIMYAMHQCYAYIHVKWNHGANYHYHFCVFRRIHLHFVGFHESLLILFKEASGEAGKHIKVRNILLAVASSSQLLCHHYISFYGGEEVLNFPKCIEFQ